MMCDQHDWRAVDLHLDILECRDCGARTTMTEVTEYPSGYQMAVASPDGLATGAPRPVFDRNVVGMVDRLSGVFHGLGTP